MRQAVVSASIVLALTLLFGAFYKGNNLHVTPFRAESGMYLAAAHQRYQAQFVEESVIAPYNGHFTPLVFAAELVQARIIGASERGWFWRQMLVLGLLGAALIRLTSLLFTRSGLSARGSLLGAFLTTCMFVLQPTVVELASWPFMAFQLLSLTCAGMSAYHMQRLCDKAERRDLLLFLSWAYASMHCFGVGAAFSAAAVFSAAILAWILRMSRACWIIVAGFGALTVAHALIMNLSTGYEAGISLPLAINLERFGAFFIGSVYTGVKSLWANGRFPWPNVDANDIDSVYGLALVAIGIVTVLLYAYRARKDGDKVALTNAATLAFSMSALAIYCFLTVYRNRAVADPHVMDGYIFGTRYIIYPAFLVFLAGSAVVVPVAHSLRGLVIVPLAMAGLACAIATTVFLGNVDKLWPHLRQSSQVLWNQNVDRAREQIKSTGFVDDKQLIELDPELRSRLSLYRGLLERELKCKGCVRFDGEQFP